ncbi:DUF4124 domain-containing protein [Thauera butanivorans]|uniref:DUF4124 domain-containing protein n=1 Tax=Thauera butanivorans TaxID=86174 RepID=UPI000839ACC8|nr:DUF4124 domain-containing protein [Thauera butanivorans]
MAKSTVHQKGEAMKSIIIAFVFAGLSAPAVAQVYKCTEGGKTVYSQMPCPVPSQPAARAASRAAVEQSPEEMRREVEAEYARLRAEAEKEAEVEEDGDRSLPVPLSPSESRYSARSHYTRAELMQMVGNGRFPEQGAVSTKVDAMSFDACIVAADAVTKPLRGAYPVITVVNTSVMYTVKLWTNDAAMTITCSAFDGKMIVTTAPYL